MFSDKEIKEFGKVDQPKPVSVTPDFSNTGRQEDEEFGAWDNEDEMETPLTQLEGRRPAEKPAGNY